MGGSANHIITRFLLIPSPDNYWHANNSLGTFNFTACNASFKWGLIATPPGLRGEVPLIPK